VFPGRHLKWPHAAPVGLAKSSPPAFLYVFSVTKRDRETEKDREKARKMERERQRGRRRLQACMHCQLLALIQILVLIQIFALLQIYTCILHTQSVCTCATLRKPSTHKLSFRVGFSLEFISHMAAESPKVRQVCSTSIAL